MFFVYFVIYVNLLVLFVFIVLYVYYKCIVNLFFGKGFKDFIVGLLKFFSKYFYCFIFEKM